MSNSRFRQNGNCTYRIISMIFDLLSLFDSVGAGLRVINQMVSNITSNAEAIPNNKIKSITSNFCVSFLPSKLIHSIQHVINILCGQVSITDLTFKCHNIWDKFGFQMRQPLNKQQTILFYSITNILISMMNERMIDDNLSDEKQEMKNVSSFKEIQYSLLSIACLN